MSHSTSDRVSGQPHSLHSITGGIRFLRQIGPAEIRACLIEIASETKRGPVRKTYLVEVHEHGYRLTTFDAKRQHSVVYDIPATIDLCDCRDYEHRSAKREDHLCKHCKAISTLVEQGRLPRLECRPVVDWNALEDAETDADISTRPLA